MLTELSPKLLEASFLSVPVDAKHSVLILSPKSKQALLGISSSQVSSVTVATAAVLEFIEYYTTRYDYSANWGNHLATRLWADEAEQFDILLVNSGLASSYSFLSNSHVIPHQLLLRTHFHISTMIGTSPAQYVFIRICIFLLHYFPLLVILALVLTLIIDHDAHRLMLLLEIISIAEVIFYVLVYIPKYRLCQRPATHPPLQSREQRRQAFQKCYENISDPEQYLSKWFLNAPLSTIRRENVKEFYCWALFNRSSWGPDEEQELDEYTDKIEEILGRKIQPGRGSAKALRLTIDPVNILHRPLLWYTIVAAVDVLTFIYMRLDGFQFYRLPFSRFMTVFPLRLITLTSLKTTPSSTMSYWYKPHTSRTGKPVVFIHGIGIGLWPYVNFLKEINKAQSGSTDDQIGIIVIEMMTICARITGEMRDQDSLCDDVMAIVKERHGWNNFVLVSQSYGSVLITNLLKRPDSSACISSVVTIDPVTFLLHLPDVAFNFTRRVPRRANEHQLYYFASTDIMVAHTLARHFFWMQNILWKDDISDRNVTVVLGGKDLIVPTQIVGRYLTEDGPGYERFLTEDEGSNGESDNWKNTSWKGEGLDIVWLENCDHAQAFENRRDYRRLADIVRAYSAETDR